MLLKHFGIYDIFCGSLTGDIAAGSGYDELPPRPDWQPHSQETSQPAAVMTSIPELLGRQNLTGDIAAGSGYDTGRHQYYKKYSQETSQPAAVMTDRRSL